jgi:pimeloyl-ACP methyl ester carboxylesterase
MRFLRLCGTLAFVLAVVIGPAALPAVASGAPMLTLVSSATRLGATAMCAPVAGGECGSVRVPLFWSNPAGRKIDVGYALIRHRDRSRPVAAGSVVINPGGPGGDVIQRASAFVQQLGPLLVDHDLLLIDPRGTGRSHPIKCGVTAVPATRSGLVRGFAACRRALGVQARAYTSAATADDVEAVRAHLGIPRLDLLGQS